MMFSTYSGPFLKENDVSRRAGKSIYAEDQAYDGQTQHTEQAMVSCAAVRTELKMARVSTEDINNTLDTISSSPSKVQLSSNTSSLLTATNSNSYPISEIYNESLLEKDFNNEEIELPTNSLNDRSYISPNPSSLELYNPTTCYNKFLYYYRLQSLPSPQTIDSFLQYILEYYPMFYSNQYIKISVKPHPQLDYVFTEAHIYLLYENLIPGHFIISSFGELPTFCNIELKLFNNNFQIPIFTDNPFFSSSNLQLHKIQTLML